MRGYEGVRRLDEYGGAFRVGALGHPLGVVMWSTQTNDVCQVRAKQ